MEASYGGGRGPEGAVVPYLDGWMNGNCVDRTGIVLIFNLLVFVGDIGH